MKLHLGCAKHKLDGWVNIDRKSTPAVDLVWDLKRGLPYQDNTVRYIYCEHLFEHFSLLEGSQLLKECYRVLKITGVVRVGVPSLERAIRHYINDDWKLERWTSRHERNGRKVQTKGEFINAYFRWWEHQFIYDAETLQKAFTEAGFKQVQCCTHRVSEHPELCEIEFHSAEETDLIVEGAK